MKKIQLVLSVALLSFALVLLSCKAPKEFMDTISVTPNPMELHAGKVSVKIDGTFPEKYFKKKLVLKVTPVLVSNTTGKRYEGVQTVYQGESIQGNGIVINYKKGGKYSQTAEFVYAPDMESCQLFLEAVASYKGKEYVVEAEKIADGVVVTPLLVSYAPGELNPQINPDKFQREIEERQDAEIKFLINQSDVRSSETRSKEMVALTKIIQEAKKNESRELKGFEISSYASPDGAQDLNENLAKKREEASNKYVKGQMKKLRADLSIDSDFTAEDWQGFKTLMEASSIQDKEVILSVLTRYTDPEEREAQIKMLSAAYKEIADEILPQLRRSKITLVSAIIGRSDDEIKTQYNSDPSVLSVEELLYAATLTDVNSEKKAIYQVVIAQYPEDVRGYNNLGVVEFHEGNYEEANRLFSKALMMDNKNGVSNFNNAVIALYNNDVQSAEEYLGKSNGVGDNLHTANGVMNIMKGKYSTACSNFAKEQSNNAALARILNKDYSQAKEILNNIERPNGLTYYLLAVVGARQNDTPAVLKNLAQAIVMDNNYAMKAAKDAEFRAYAENEAFQALLK